jgi:hypothetical protein
LAAGSRADQAGNLPRDFHVALSALALLRHDQRDRIAFKKEGEERVLGVSAWKVSYVEQRGPAIWRSLGNVPLGTRGMFWIDAADGRVLRSRVEVGSAKTTEQFRIEVDYVPDPALGVLVPGEMREKYESDAGARPVRLLAQARGAAASNVASSALAARWLALTALRRGH